MPGTTFTEARLAHRDGDMQEVRFSRLAQLLGLALGFPKIIRDPLLGNEDYSIWGSILRTPCLRAHRILCEILIKRENHMQNEMETWGLCSGRKNRSILVEEGNQIEKNMENEMKAWMIV